MVVGNKAADRFKGRLRFARAFETVGRAESVFCVGSAEGEQRSRTRSEWMSERDKKPDRDRKQDARIEKTKRVTG